jgi:hypothetical protein
MRFSVRAVIAAILFVFSAANAASEQGLEGAILNCSAQADAKAQLDCYNGIAAQLKAHRAESTAPAQVTRAPEVSSPPPQATAEAPKQAGSAWYNPTTWFGSNESPQPARPMVGNPADFGGENLPEAASSAPKPLDHITAKVTGVSYNYFRRFTVTLDNGQVWRQAESDTKVARFGDDGGEAVTISRGFLDAFSLVIDGRWGTYQVKRIK